jgi:hypothetical protein
MENGVVRDSAANQYGAIAWYPSLTGYGSGLGDTAAWGDRAVYVADGVDTPGGGSSARLTRLTP